MDNQDPKGRSSNEDDRVESYSKYQPTLRTLDLNAIHRR